MRIDLHVHSKLSKRPTAWFLKKIGCPESFSEPLHIYRLAKERGMTHVTITDHNCIDGALEIAHLPDVFISEEVTTYFPEDRCKLHVLALNITERHHEDIQKLRKNVFELIDYLREASVVHVLAHPLYRVNDRLTLDHFEKLLLMFNNLEMNGARNDESNDCLERIVKKLTREDLERLSYKHDISPYGKEPWKKNFTGGSDDHSSLNIARTHTHVAGARNLAEFFDGLLHQKSEVIRLTATPKMMAHNLYGIAYQYYRNKFNLKLQGGKDSLLQFLDRSLSTHAEDAEPGLMEKLTFLWQHRSRRQKRKTQSFLPDSLIGLIRQESRRMLKDSSDLMKLTSAKGSSPIEDNWYEFVNQASNRVMKHFADHLMGHLSGANVFNIFQTVGAAGGLYTMLAPYFIAYSIFTRDRQFNRMVSEKFLRGSKNISTKTDPTVVAHFTDTLYEINGVAHTLRQNVDSARKNGKNLTVITCDDVARPPQPGIRNFKPIGVYHLPEYPEQKIFYPPLLEMMTFCFENRVNHIHSSTPGPVGLAALAVAHILKLPISGTYHTQLPQYAMFLTGDPMIKDLTWKYTLWYYDQMDIVYAPSKSTRAELVEKKIRPEKVRIYPRGIDVDRFQPSKKNGILKARYGIVGKTVFLYVGRVSREKNLELLADAFISLSQNREDVHLVVVGDGPYISEMKSRLHSFPCTFTGYLKGEELATVYASSDVFVFPSDTDTFGNVVLEAQASGLPVIVSDQGGPVENVVPGETALIMPTPTSQGLSNLMAGLASKPERRRSMGTAARKYAESRSFDRAFMETWRMYAAALTEPEKTPSAA